MRLAFQRHLARINRALLVLSFLFIHFLAPNVFAKTIGLIMDGSVIEGEMIRQADSVFTESPSIGRLCLPTATVAKKTSTSSQAHLTTPVTSAHSNKT